MKKKRKKGRKKRKGVGSGVYGITATVKQAAKTTVSKDVFMGVAAGFGGATLGRLVSSLLGPKVAPASASPGTKLAIMNVMTAGTGAVAGAVIGKVFLKNMEAAKMAAAANMTLALDGVFGQKIHEMFGFSMGQLRLPEDVAIAGTGQLRLPEDVTISGQYDDMDQVIEEEDLMGETEDDERGVF